MQHTIRNLAKSTFQRYKVRANRSSEKRVMAPGSRSVGAVFSRFSSEDSGQTGEAIGELRVASCSWSCSLCYAPGLTDQIAVGWKESARERDCPGGKTHQIFSVFSLFLSVFARMENVVPNVDFQRSWCHRKARVTLFLKVLDLRETELGLERYGPANRGHQSVFGSPEDVFPIEISARLGKILAIRKLHAVSEHVLFMQEHY